MDITSLSFRLRSLSRAFVFAFISLSVCAQAYAERFAYVDLARAVFEVEDGKAAKARLEKMMKQRQKALDAKQAEIKQMQEGLEKQAEFMSDEVKRQKAIEFQTKLRELKVMYDKLQRELATEEAKIQTQIIGRMSDVLKAMGEESNYAMIVRKEALLWAPNHLDITNELIRRYNNYLSKQSGSKPKTKSKRRKRKRRKTKTKSK